MGGTVGQQATNVLSVAWQSAARLKVPCAVQTANMQDRSRFVAAMNVNWTPSTTYFFLFFLLLVSSAIYFSFLQLGSFSIFGNTLCASSFSFYTHIAFA